MKQATQPYHTFKPRKYKDLGVPRSLGPASVRVGLNMVQNSGSIRLDFDPMFKLRQF